VIVCFVDIGGIDDHHCLNYGGIDDHHCLNYGGIDDHHCLNFLFIISIYSANIQAIILYQNVSNYNDIKKQQ
jgi:hypothetical protein